MLTFKINHKKLPNGLFYKNNVLKILDKSLEVYKKCAYNYENVHNLEQAVCQGGKEMIMICIEFPHKKQKTILCILTVLLDSEPIKTTLNKGGICSAVFDDIFAAFVTRWVIHLLFSWVTLTGFWWRNFEVAQ